MEPNGTNDNRVPTVLCKTGCGFYGSLACEGMCSKCYADLVKSRHETARAEKMGEQSSTGAEPLSNSRASSEIRLQQDRNSEGEGICEALRRTSVSEKDVNNETSSAENLNLSQSANSSATNSSTAAAAAAALKNIEPTPQDTVEPAGIDKKSSADSKEANVSAEGKSKKSNRCHICKKKVGLTGFPCRCGGLYCSMHRYSDTHSCTFNYKELAQEDIRKNNPVVVGEKIKKI